MSQRTTEILLVEDSPTDVELTIEALREASFPIHLSTVSDGEEAIEFLAKQGRFADSPRPDLIVLDLNLPRKDGREVLAEIKADPALRRIPVIILSTSRSEQDVLKTYSLHANAYVAKPVDFNDFTRVIRAIEDFWLGAVTLAPGKTPVHATT